ncbi:MAG: FtsX-like permease family protein [candidate division Zixibacteria bacterium]|nr:FtsX-like permease family protein [candidate division Zixibacteria bacterium]
MIKFILKGIFRDRSRSLFPIIVVIGGVMLSVVLYSWMKGFEKDIVRANANFRSGHLIIMSKAYSGNSDQMPNDLAYIGCSDLIGDLNNEHPGIIWQPRIRFAGLIDVPDENGETMSQGPIVGLGADLISPSTIEPDVLNLNGAIVSGGLPLKAGEMLITDELAQRLNIKPGQTATIITTTMYGSLTTFNMVVCGTIRFGIAAMDRGLVIADIGDIRRGLDMNDAAGEIVGFFSNGSYLAERAESVAESFNMDNSGSGDDFAPVMYTLLEHSGLAATLKMYKSVSGVLISIFITAMSIVLWNAGLLGSIRRYGEFGIRLAIGESQGHLYRFLIAESTLIGLFGTIIGTAFGLLFSLYLQEVGINISSMLKNASIVISDVLRAQITPTSYIIGFVPGLAATLLGSSISGIGIYRRQTSQLTKEFEA